MDPNEQKTIIWGRPPSQYPHKTFWLMQYPLTWECCWARYLPHHHWNPRRLRPNTLLRFSTGELPENGRRHRRWQGQRTFRLRVWKDYCTEEVGECVNCPIVLFLIQEVSILGIGRICRVKILVKSPLGDYPVIEPTTLELALTSRSDNSPLVISFDLKFLFRYGLFSESIASNSIRKDDTGARIHPWTSATCLLWGHSPSTSKPFHMTWT